PLRAHLSRIFALEGPSGNRSPAGAFRQSPGSAREGRGCSGSRGGRGRTPGIPAPWSSGSGRGPRPGSWTFPWPAGRCSNDRPVPGTGLRSLLGPARTSSERSGRGCAYGLPASWRSGKCGSEDPGILQPGSRYRSLCMFYSTCKTLYRLLGVNVRPTATRLRDTGRDLHRGVVVELDLELHRVQNPLDVGFPGLLREREDDLVVDNDLHLGDQIHVQAQDALSDNVPSRTLADQSRSLGVGALRVALHLAAEAVVQQKAVLSLGTDLVLPLLQTRVGLLHHLVELLRDLDVHARLGSSTLGAETVVEPVAQDLGPVPPFAIGSTEGALGVGGVQVHSRLEQLHVLLVTAVGGDSPRVNLVQVNGDQNLSRVGQEDSPLDVAATALAQDSEARVLDGPTAGSLVRRDLRVNPVSDEVVLDRLVHGPLTGHRDDQLAQVLDLVELDLGGVHAVPAKLLRVAVEADALLKVVLVGRDVLGLLGPRHRRSPEAAEYLFQPLLSINGGQRVLVLLEVVLLPLVLGHLAQRETVIVVEALEVGL